MKYFVADAFTDEPFKGNPAGVCVLDEWHQDKVMQNIAYENNLAETAFIVKSGDYYDLKWFTPEVEIDLCGHATLASAFVLSRYFDKESKKFEFHTMSGILTVERDGDVYYMNFPSRKPTKIGMPDHMQQALGILPLEAYRSRDIMVVLENEKQVKNLNPDFEKMKLIKDCFGIIVTAKGDEADFVSRYFAPNAGIAEDPVTGSSHSTLIPFWAERLELKKMIAKQLSKRGGTLFCEDLGDRVIIGGRASIYSIGEILI